MNFKSSLEPKPDEGVWVWSLEVDGQVNGSAVVASGKAVTRSMAQDSLDNAKGWAHGHVITLEAVFSEQGG